MLMADRPCQVCGARPAFWTTDPIRILCAECLEGLS